jgi:hypothetical protein
LCGAFVKGQAPVGVTKLVIRDHQFHYTAGRRSFVTTPPGRRASAPPDDLLLAFETFAPRGLSLPLRRCSQKKWRDLMPYDFFADDEFLPIENSLIDQDDELDMLLREIGITVRWVEEEPLSLFDAAQALDDEVPF